MRVGALGLALLLVACPSPPKSVGPTEPDANGCSPVRDHAAILKMAGDFDVSFEFAETEALQAGYTPKDGYQTDAREIVIVLADTGHFVSLQHVLLLRDGGGNVTPQKHWRQDWHFEDARLFEFQGKDAKSNDSWKRRDLPADSLRCTWSQAVYEVSDAPRYESFGRWTHSPTESAWLSGTTWRPLPRREYTKRKDYDALVGTNRHVVTAEGWRQEQENVKHISASRSDIVRERGVNRYTRAEVSGADEVRKYMADTGRFWSAVREEWALLETSNPRLSLAFEVNGKQMWEHLFPLADELHAAPVEEQRKRAHAAIAPYVSTL